MKKEEKELKTTNGSTAKAKTAAKKTANAKKASSTPNMKEAVASMSSFRMLPASPGNRIMI